MPVTVACECSNTFTLKDEFAGRMVKCPSCGAAVRAGTTQFTPESQADPVFGRDVFLMRQQALRINERYDVTDEQGRPILFVERPAHFLRNVGALLAGLAAAFVAISIATSIVDALQGSTLASLLALVMFPCAFASLVIVPMALSKKRHVTFYADQSKTVQLLDVLQDSKFAFINARYTVRDAQGATIARFRKNYLFNFFRRKWDVLAPTGDAVQWVAREDSIILSLVRRFVPLMSLIRTNFIFQPAGSDRVVGEFRRKMTILDRYVLDLKADRARALDRRVAVALGVMLDTGERR
jgi:uncharacterized protein YxjI